MKKIIFIIIISFLIPSINLFGKEIKEIKELKVKTFINKTEKLEENKVETKKVTEDFKNEKSEKLIFNEKNEKKEKKDEGMFSFFAPENFIGIIYFLILLGGLIVMKRIFFAAEAPRK